MQHFGHRIAIQYCGINATLHSWWCLKAAQDVDDRELANQFAVPWELEAKAGNNLLRHEVVPHIPTNATVQGFGHDVINRKVHARLSLGSGDAHFSARLPSGGNLRGSLL